MLASIMGMSLGAGTTLPVADHLVADDDHGRDHQPVLLGLGSQGVEVDDLDLTGNFSAALRASRSARLQLAQGGVVPKTLICSMSHLLPLSESTLQPADRAVAIRDVTSALVGTRP